MKRHLLLFTLCLSAAGFAAESEEKKALEKFFETDVRPILANRCYECHGDKKQKGGLRADNLSFLI
ncbi:MAG: c-type cytochrome domain-containing protein, partial [Verrucomicrobiota bacterium]